MSKLLEQMINKEFSTGEFTHDTFDLLYPSVRAGDIKAIDKMTKLAFPYFYKYAVKNVGKITINDMSEYASYIYEIIAKHVKMLAKKGNKTYTSFTSQLKVEIRKVLTRIAKKEMSDILNCGDDICCVESRVIENYLIDSVTQMLEFLNDEEKFIITEYFGMNESGKKSFNQISKEMGLGRKTVFQIYTSAVKKLRMYSSVTVDDKKI